MQLRAQYHAWLIGSLALWACGVAGASDPLSPAMWRHASAVAGSETIEVRAILARAANVEWALYASAQPGLTAAQARAGTADTIRTGSFAVSTGDVGDTVRARIAGLVAGTAYYLYVAATPNQPDPAPDDLTAVHEFAVTMAARQAALGFQSAAAAAQVGYYAYLPEAHYLDASERLPLLVFLHGSGEKGNGTTELSRVLVHGPPKLVRNGRDLPFILISPQLPASQGSWPTGLVDELVNRAIADYRVDTTRIYVTGLSLGGFGTWAYATSKPARVAAVAPIAGGGSSGPAVCAMRTVPVWAFHGDADGTVNVSSTVNSVNALNACVPAPAVAPKLTIYAGVGHDSWTRTYDGTAGHDIYAWLLTHRR